MRPLTDEATPLMRRLCLGPRVVAANDESKYDTYADTRLRPSNLPVSFVDWTSANDTMAMNAHHSNSHRSRTFFFTGDTVLVSEEVVVVATAASGL